MKNDGRFKAGHKETIDVKIKRIESMKKSWNNRSNYHGMHGTLFYNVWRSMITRCNGTAGKDSIKKYKDKNIVVCDKWKSFKGFYEDMIDGYSDGLTIDRIDNLKGYYKENCRWATHKQQANNKQNNVRICFDGKDLTLSQWADELNVPFYSLRNRYYTMYKRGKINREDVIKKYITVAKDIH